MDVTLIDSTAGSTRYQFLMSTLINKSVVIDAGCIGFWPALNRQQLVRHVFISHSHMDHVASLPIFLENVYSAGPECPTIYGSQTVLQTLQRHLFNGQIWPDVVEMSTGESRFVALQQIRPGVPVAVDELKITPIELDHAVPTTGFIVEDHEAAVAFVSDTRPTAAIWQAINQTQRLQAVFLEASFPSNLQWLAEKSGHLTPTSLAAEVRKLTRPARVIVVHIKSAYRQQVETELSALTDLPLEVGQPGRTYRF